MQLRVLEMKETGNGQQKLVVRRILVGVGASSRRESSDRITRPSVIFGGLKTYNHNLDLYHRLRHRPEPWEMMEEGECIH